MSVFSGSVQQIIKEKETILKSIKDELREWLEEHGDVDANGSQKHEFDDGNRIELILRQSINMDVDSAVPILKELNLDSCYREVTTYKLDEQQIEDRFRDGVISQTQLKEMTNVKESKAFYLKGVK